MITFSVNGKKKECPSKFSIASFLKKNNLNAGSIIVEYNNEFFAREKFANTYIREGDKIEIIKAFAGG